MKITKKEVTRLAANLLKEDKAYKDITSNYFIDNKQQAKATIFSNESIIVAGIDFVIELFKRNCKNIKILSKLKDGSKIKKKENILIIQGNGRKILSAERAALNLLQHLSGISTLTGKLCEKIKKKKLTILDTRKTTPGLRKFEKYAVSIGGAKNHRLDLSESYMLKDNHLILNNKIYEKIAKMNNKQKKRLILECDNLIQVKKAIDLNVKYILLDNMNIKNIKKAKKIIGKKAKIEVSGGINLKNITKISSVDIDFISIGAITHSAPAANISLDIQKI
ncbi:MAG: Nicotinate-nucleotide pyrophosphorylase [carboxylating] [Alphaproteobacteria bacterium MarineAlpha6_Bin1]|nr:MAG: Nicotinate-nucleotide pyrophosphorylase [carboxylating] [Alphaproteobacteria bacterium MarineAlpha6_Bin1]